MRFVLYLVTMLLTGFVAGIFRSRVLVFLFLAECVLLLLLLLQAVLACISVSARSVTPLWLFRKDEEQTGEFLLCSRLFLPIRRLILRGSLRYDHETEPLPVKLSGGLTGRPRHLTVSLRCPLCGIRNLRISSLSCGDALGLFSFRKRCRTAQEIAVLPPAGPRFSFDLSSVSTALATLENAPSATYMREHDEFRQIREYVPGDSLRTIDWHQSARSDSLMVREYDTLQEYYIDLEVAGNKHELPTAAGFSAFYELIAALAREDDGYIARAFDLLLYSMEWPADEKAHPIVTKFFEMLFDRSKTLDSVSGYAERLGISPSYLNKLVRTQTRHSAMDWVEISRVNWAKCLLKDSDMAVGDISVAIGVDDPSYFTRFFRKSTGMTPSEFRRAMAKKEKEKE